MLLKQHTCSNELSHKYKLIAVKEGYVLPLLQSGSIS